MVGDARYKDTGTANGTARQIRPRRRCVFGRTSEGATRLLSRVSIAPATCAGKTPAKWLWGDGSVRCRLIERSPWRTRVGEIMYVGGEFGWRRDVNISSRHHDACVSGHRETQSIGY